MASFIIGKYGYPAFNTNRDDNGMKDMPTPTTNEAKS